MLAFHRLEDAVKTYNQRALSDLEEQGLIQTFEYTHELAWNVFKDFLEEQSVLHLYSSRYYSTSFKRELIDNGAIWMDMIISQNLITIFS
ncbi:MAG: nucleotidyltransferase substrate binding protein [Spirochaetes bacterium]|nr:nucleotidyltransferase substrate binding protein [Spirochaetota bacterium]